MDVLWIDPGGRRVHRIRVTVSPPRRQLSRPGAGRLPTPQTGAISHPGLPEVAGGTCQAYTWKVSFRCNF